MAKTLICLFGCLISLSACGQTETVKLISPSIPAELLTPVPQPDRQVATLRDAGLLIVDYDEALNEANSKIESTAAIMAKFSKRIANVQ